MRLQFRRDSHIVKLKIWKLSVEWLITWIPCTNYRGRIPRRTPRGAAVVGGAITPDAQLGVAKKDVDKLWLANGMIDNSNSLH